MGFLCFISKPPVSKKKALEKSAKNISTCIGTASFLLFIL
jgi:hypothetical protein